MATEAYCRYLVKKMEGLNHEDIRYQEDGATAYTACETMIILNRLFPGCFISKSTDFCLCGYIKDRVFPNPQTLAVLSGKKLAILAILLENVMKNALKKINIALMLSVAI